MKRTAHGFTVKLIFGVAVWAVLLLSGCAPSAGNQGGPLVAILNAPSESLLPGSAERLQQAFAKDPTIGFRLVSGGAMRFQETHNDFFHSRAAGTAGRVARSYGAQIAVMVGAEQLTRDVTVSDDHQTRRVEVSVQMKATLVDAATDDVVATQYGVVLQASRRESNQQPLVDIKFDPDVRALRDQGVDAIGRTVEANLRDRLGLDSVE